MEVRNAIRVTFYDIWPEGSRFVVSVTSFDEVASDSRVQDALKRAGEVFGRSHRNWIRYWSFDRDYDVVVKRSFLQELISGDDGAVEVGAIGASIDVGVAGGTGSSSSSSR